MLANRRMLSALVLIPLLFFSCSQETADNSMSSSDTTVTQSITTLQDVQAEPNPDVVPSPEVAPSVEVSPTEIVVSSPVILPKITRYLVKKGDTLWSIAKAQGIYADAHQWPLIFRTNVTKIKDPDLIKPGMILEIQHDFDQVEVAAAIKHAKTRGAWKVGEPEQSDGLYLQQAG